jgi:hypothetical protein
MAEGEEHVKVSIAPRKRGFFLRLQGIGRKWVRFVGCRWLRGHPEAPATTGQASRLREYALGGRMFTRS